MFANIPARKANEVHKSMFDDFRRKFKYTNGLYFYWASGSYGIQFSHLHGIEKLSYNKGT